MQHGLPCIATYGGGIPEVVTDRETGLLINPDDDEALVQKVKEILDNPSFREQLSNNSKRIFHQKFTSEVMASRTLENYRSVAKL